MTHRILIKNATLINEGQIFKGSLLIKDKYIEQIITNDLEVLPNADEVIDATGCYLMPGVIDCHVHFREPGLTDKADILHESKAAAAGGVTSVFDMPNTVPQTTTMEAFEEKNRRFAEQCCVNYSVFFGATNTNLDLLLQLNPQTTCGVKLFMGSSTGNMLVDQDDALDQLFSSVKLPIMTHCEDTDIINANMAEVKSQWGDDPAVEHHPEIRSAEACYQSTARAVDLAQKHGTSLHVAHLTTRQELTLFNDANKQITAEVCIPHLVFSDADYKTLGSLIKCNPAVKSEVDRSALRAALNDGSIHTIATDHAPHTLTDKQGGAAKAVSGMPMVQFSLVSMLELVNEGVLSLDRMVELMCHNPALRFDIKKRGFLRLGYRADLVLVRPNSPWTLSKTDIESKCKWSPLEGKTFQWKIERTYCNGYAVYKNNAVDPYAPCGERITFER
ncbi:MAG: dihydroorotase [Bacteroidaceae bacterium]|nr:dihydroorotase [Bacteroidaceae bacterium]